LGWLKGYCHDRNHSSENIVSGYGKVTLVRRVSTDVRKRLLSTYARFDLDLPSTSFLRTSRKNVGASRAGAHEVTVVLSRRNHRVVRNPAESERRLWTLLKKVHGNERLVAPTTNILDFPNSGVELNAFSVRPETWYMYDNVHSSFVGKVTRVFACEIPTRHGPLYECFVYIERCAEEVRSIDDTDFIVDITARVVVEAIPVKTLTAAMFAVPHWDESNDEYTPNHVRVLFVKYL
jgi:hypothetical protein